MADIKRIGVLTGGGDCPGLNPAIRGVVMRAFDYGWEVQGFRRGWAGLTEDIPTPLSIDIVDEIIDKGGTILGSSRTNPYKMEGGPELCLATLKRHNIDALVAIGGDDTLSVAAKLWNVEHFPTVGVPKTMDNDLSGTDYTFGYDTAVQIAVEAVGRLRDTAKSHERVLVLEVMGRHAGWVAWATGLAGAADWTLVPEEKPDWEAMAAHMRKLKARGQNYAIIVASEGIELPCDDNEDCELDAFGHKRLIKRGVGEYVATYLEEQTGMESRFAVIGHMQRGGPPTAFDRILGTRVGVAAADFLSQGKFGSMAALQGTEIVAVDISHASGVTKTVPQDCLELMRVFFK